jgi:hypothetical protein
MKAGITAAEDKILSIVLREIRHANATRQPVHITIDPWIPVAGANVHVDYEIVRRETHEVDGEIRKSRKPSRGRRSRK